MKKFAKILLFSILSSVALSTILLFYYENTTKNAIFYPSKLENTEQNLIMYANNGTEINYTNGKTSVPVKIDDLPPYLPNAFIAIEDKRFYSHKGLDYKRILSATVTNLKNFSFKEGASTISQQLIKNTHLSSEKTLKRKLCEIKLTKTLEKKYTKKEILQYYLNNVYFGKGAYGIENAAKIYFNKKAANLSLKESAMLAATVKAPTTYSPSYEGVKNEQRTKTVLNEMKKQKFINQNQYEQALSERPNLSTNESAKKNGNVFPIKNAYAKEVFSELERLAEKNKISIYEKIFIETYYDEETEKILENACNELTENNNYTAIIKSAEDNSIIGLTTTVPLTKRPPASTVKPWLIYAPAFENNILSQATKILDEKTDFNGFYFTNNGDKYNGFISVKRAIEKSLNVPAVKTAQALGEKNLKKYGREFGVNVNSGLGVALGGIDEGLTVKQTVDIYSTFCNEGVYEESSYIKKITDNTGKILYENKRNGKKVYSPQTTFIINDCLYGVTKNGTGRKIGEKKINVCSKTGTNGNKKGNTDAYCVSYSPKYVLVVHLSNNKGTLMDNSVSGGTYPAIISAEIWKEISNKEKISTFSEPIGVEKIKLDKTSYDIDHKLYKGSDGEEFYFKTELIPPTVNKNISPLLTETNYSCSDGVFELSFKSINTDGVLIQIKKDGKELSPMELYDKDYFTFNVADGSKYLFSITPFKIVNEKKITGKTSLLPEIQYKHKSTPKTKKWWLPDN